MRKVCGGCNLCCKLEKIPEIEKPRNQMCRQCIIRVGCGIYNERPKPCREFQCMWLIDADMPDELRPDKIGAYAVELDGYAKVCVDADHGQTEKDHRLLNYLSGKGLHAIVSEGRSVTFWPAKNKAIPERIMLDWTL